jgi:putative restriction endonuclease
MDVRLPFHHLRYEGFWSALQADGQPSPNPEQTRFAAMAEDFLAALREPAWRSKARRILIATYFTPAERVALYTATGLPVPSDEEIIHDRSFKTVDAKEQGREARFRFTVVAAYNYACALTGLRLTTITTGSVVDAAHIHQFSASRNNAPENGIALCKNAHWAFDQGRWTLTDDHRVMVGIDRFDESSPDGRALASYHGQKLRLPANPAMYPSPIHLAWHRKKHKYG